MVNRPDNCRCTTPQYTLVLNQQGAQGLRGQKGEEGFSPRVTVVTDTPTEYVLKILTRDGEITTPNLRASIPVGGQVGDVLTTVDDEGNYTWQPLPIADDEEVGLVQLALIEDTNPDEEGNVNSEKAVTPKVLVEYTKQETDKLETKINEEIEPKLNNLQSEFDTKVQQLEEADTKLQNDLTTKEQELKQSISDTQQALQQEIDKKLDTSIAEQTYALKTDVNALSENVTQNTNDITQLKEDVQDVVTDLGTKANASELESLQTDVTELQTQVQTNTTEIANINGDLANETAEREEADRAINTALEGKQDKLIAGENITIDPETNTISASGGTGDVTHQEFETLEQRVTDLETVIDGGNAEGKVPINVYKQINPVDESPRGFSEDIEIKDGGNG